MARESGPLAGCRVVDLSSFMAAPLATMLLAEQGADVVKVEPLSGDPFRRVGTQRASVGSIFLNTNRGKRSLAVDVKHPKGLEIVEQLVRRADVFVENFRPGKAEQLGIGPKQLLEANPRLVYASVTGFGREGPYVGRPVFDPVIQGYSGLAWAQRERGTPRLMKTLVADKVCPLLAAQAITAALLERERSGVGQHVEISMFDAAVWWMWPDLMANHTFLGDDDLFKTDLVTAVHTLYETADGFIVASPMMDHHFTAMATATGRLDWLTHPRFSKSLDRRSNSDEYVAELSMEFRKRPTAEWLRLLRDADIPCGAVHEPDALLTDAHLRATDQVVELSHPIYGVVRGPRAAARFGRSAAPTAAPAPVLGEHTRELLADLGLVDQEVAALFDAGVVS